MTTMKDVAERAGVSVTTVSRVMNNRGSISEKTRKKVFEAIEELNFHPNEMARALMTNKTHIIGLIVPAVDHPYFSKVVDHVEAICAAAGYKLLLCTSDHSSEKELKMSAMLQANKVDGVLLYSQREDATPYVEYKLPVVVIDKIIPGIPSVLCDNYQGGVFAARTLIESGSIHPIVFGFEDRSNNISMQRINGFRDECVRNNIEYRDYIIDFIDPQSNTMMETFPQHFTGLFKKYPETDGIFTTNEIIATKALEQLNEMGKSVPDVVQIVGYDGTILSKLMNLTTVVQPVEQMCNLALETLFKRMEGDIVPSTSILPVSVIKRKSTIC